MNRILLPVSLVCLSLWGCSSVSLDQAGAGGAPIQSRESAISGGQASSVLSKQGTGSDLGASPLTPDWLKSAGYNAQGEASIFFEFNQPQVKPEYQPLLSATADMLKSNPKTVLSVEGHADERGTVEYNLSLGQRRSDAVEQALRLLGVREDQIKTMSFGEEKPRSLGHTEADYAQNRRADLILKAARP